MFNKIVLVTTLFLVGTVSFALPSNLLEGGPTIVQVTRPGFGFSPGCHSWSLSYVPSAHNVNASLCKNNSSVKISKQLSDSQVSQLEQLINEIQISPIPANPPPCPADLISMWAERVTLEGRETYTAHACGKSAFSYQGEIKISFETQNQLESFLESL